MKSLQQWLVQQRKQKNLTQQQLAKILNRPTLYIHDIEHGTHVLGIIEFLQYCQALEVDYTLAIEVIQNELQKKS